MMRLEVAPVYIFMISSLLPWSSSIGLPALIVSNPPETPLTASLWAPMSSVASLLLIGPVSSSMLAFLDSFTLFLHSLRTSAFPDVSLPCPGASFSSSGLLPFFVDSVNCVTSLPNASDSLPIPSISIQAHRIVYSPQSVLGGVTRQCYSR